MTQLHRMTVSLLFSMADIRQKTVFLPQLDTWKSLSEETTKRMKLKNMTPTQVFVKQSNLSRIKIQTVSDRRCTARSHPLLIFLQYVNDVDGASCFHREHPLQFKISFKHGYSRNESVELCNCWLWGHSKNLISPFQTCLSLPHSQFTENRRETFL